MHDRKGVSNAMQRGLLRNPSFRHSRGISKLGKGQTTPRLYSYPCVIIRMIICSFCCVPFTMGVHLWSTGCIMRQVLQTIGKPNFLLLVKTSIEEEHCLSSWIALNNSYSKRSIHARQVSDLLCALEFDYGF